MLVDQTPLSGLAAYLRDGDRLNLGGDSPASARTPVIGKGVVWDVTSLDLFIEADDLLWLFSRRDEPLLSIEVHKELFPSLFADPYSHRVHTIGGFDDFTKGTHTGLRVMEVDGHPTLVTQGTTENLWMSPVYQFDQPFRLHSAAWDPGSSRLASGDGLEYSILLHLWKQGEETGGAAPTVIDLAADLDAAAERMKEGLGNAGADIVAYRIEFRATVTHDTYFHEHHLAGNDDGRTMGRPVLRSINLLERREPTLSFHSLRELLRASNGYHFLDENAPAERLTANIDLSAALSEGEYIRLSVHHNGFRRVEARMDATIHMRPPVTE